MCRRIVAVSYRTLFVLPILCLAVTTPCRADDTLQTVAESSKYTATSRHEQVLDLCERLVKKSPVVKQVNIATTTQGRKLPALIVAEPPLLTLQEVGESSKLVVLITANIHAGEVDGKEAILALLRDLVLAKDRPLLKNIVLVVVPNLNPDGNDKMSDKNRTDQNGPMEVGERANGQGLDLNRDFIKLETPEIQGLVRAFNECNPGVFIDLHTTNGSYHRYAITYDGPRHPAISPTLIEAAHERILPAIGERLNKSSGQRSFFYGIMSPDRKAWTSYPPLPRYGIQYAGLRGCLGLLCESCSHAPYKDRVLASRAFVQASLDYLSENSKDVRKLATDAGKNAPGTIPLRIKMSEGKEPVTILGFVEEEKDKKIVPLLDKPQEYKVAFVSKAEAVLSLQKPFGYLFAPQFASVIETLQRHGIEVEELREDIELPLEIARIDKSEKAERLNNKHALNTVSVTHRKETRRIPTGTILVQKQQALGNLAAVLLEPQSEDGLTTWNFFDDAIKEGKDHPVLRLSADVPITSGRARALAADRKKNQPITLENFYAGKLPNLHGNPVGNLTWLDDGEHFLQTKQRKVYKVHAVTGKATPFLDHALLEKSLAGVPGLDKQRAAGIAAAPLFNMNPQRTGSLFDHDNDLYYLPFDGNKVIRLTKSRGSKELTEFSPDGKHVAFVKGNNLHVVDLATQTERALTSDGGDLIYNGKNSWVYFEEIFNRNWKAFWWSPDSSHIAFLRFDDKPVHKFTVVDHLPTRQDSELTPYPKSGDPNPLVKLGVVSVVSSKDPKFAPLSGYTEGTFLFSRIGWTPDSKLVYAQVQDRAQTWLDFCTMDRDGGPLTKLFREKTKAWVEDLGEPHFLKDGSFLFASERSGWKHLYHYGADGKLKKAVTSGDWEMRDLLLVDEAGGWLYFSGTRDSHIAHNVYRVKLDGSDLTRLTTTAGDHRANVSPKGNYYVDTWSSQSNPTRVQLFKTDGTAVRMLDTNPVYAVEEYQLSMPEYAQIRTPDGVVLEGTIIKPPQFDASRKYPVWFKTYGGPHAPTVMDSWWGARLEDQAMAHTGFVIFRMDPRSASGKGAVSAWTCYRQMGVQELKDIETAIKWLSQNSWVDSKRIGMSGHSYGGFMTAYAMTHSNLFAAGIAGAPVTDWRNYDSIYTERYMNTPQENPKGYDETSVVKAAAKLQGKLLIVHGIMDDNVHVQNAVQLIDALQKANKDFDMMMYPRARHPIHGKHYQKTLIEFMRKELKP